MNLSLVRACALALPVAAFGSCSVWNSMFGSSDPNPSKVNDLVGWIERVYVDSELARQEVRSAITELQSIVSKEFTGDAVAAFNTFVETMKRSEQQAKKLSDSIGPMKRTAEPVFKQWAKDLESFSSLEMRQRSQARLLETRRRYDAIVLAVDPMQLVYERFNKGLRDHSLFLGNDFNAGSTASVKADVQNLALVAKDLDAKLQATLQAAKSYVDQSSLPVAATPGAEPGR